MLNDTATVTGVVGPGITLTAGVFTGVTEFTFKTDENTLRIVSDAGINYVSISGTNTITLTAVGGLYTLTVA